MKINNNYILKKVLDNYIIIDVSNDNKTIYKLNKISSVIFESLEKGLTIDAIANLLVNTYNIDKNTAINDTNNLINELIKLNILIND